MNRLGFSLFHISIKRTGATAAGWTGSGLRNISGALSLRCCLSCPSSAELDPTPFQLLGPPEIPHSTVTVIPSKEPTPLPTFLWTQIFSMFAGI